MKQKLRYLFLTLVSLTFLVLFFYPFNTKNESTTTLKIISTTFIGYDFAKTLLQGSDAQVTMLIKPGIEMHHYDPTPQDIINIQKADLFIYNGGESEAWLDSIVANLPNTLRLMDYVELLEDEDGYDEHVWTSPRNAINIAQILREKIVELENNNHSDIYYEKLIEGLNRLDQNFSELASQNLSEILIVDRFPFKYLFKQYELNYYALLTDCGEEKDPSSKDVAKMLEKIASSPQKIVYYLKNSDTKIVQEIQKTTQAEALSLYSLDTISQEDLDSNISYLDFMEVNLNNIKKVAK